MPALRTYSFATATAAHTFRAFFPRAVVSLGKHGVNTTGVWASVSDPTKIHFLVQYPQGKEPKEVMGAYVKSDAFKADAKDMPVVSGHS